MGYSGKPNFYLYLSACANIMELAGRFESGT
jgi:hypothetical protein